MDWDPVQCTQNDKSVGYKCSRTKEEEYNTNDSSVMPDHSYCSGDLSNSWYLESDNDLDEEFYNIEWLQHKIKLIVPGRHQS